MSAFSDSVSSRLDRRTFLKGASTLGLGVALSPSALISGESPASRPRRRRYAIVGNGSRSIMYQTAIEKDFRDHAELVALCDLNPGRLALAQARSQLLGGTPPPAFIAADFERMIATTKPEIRHRHNHRRHARRLHRAGDERRLRRHLRKTPDDFAGKMSAHRGRSRPHRDAPVVSPSICVTRRPART
jgi:hypothetical protein